MKREGMNHPKIRLLARDLRIPLCYARGVVESLWLLASTSFPAGDIGRLTNEEIALGIDFDGDPDGLVQMLVHRRLLDEIEGEARLYVHDWHEHAEDGVHSRLARQGQTFANGIWPKLSRLSESERRSATGKLSAAPPSAVQRRKAPTMPCPAMPDHDPASHTAVSSNSDEQEAKANNAPDVCVSEPEPVCAASPAPPPALIAAQTTAVRERFDPGPTWEVFWRTYTSHPYGVADGEGQAKAWWFQHVRDGTYAAAIVAGLNEHVNGDRWSRGIGVPNAIRFLNEHWYRRPVVPRRTSHRADGAKHESLLAWAREMDGRKRGVA